MGSKPSAPTATVGTPSTPSRSFGRLSIHSPESARASLRTSSLRSLSSSATTATEVTPLKTATTILQKQRQAVEDHAVVVNSSSIASSSSPPVLVWIGPALICALCYALYNIFIKKGSASIHPVLGGVVLQFVAAIVGSMLLMILVMNYEHGVADLQYDNAGIAWAVLAGIAVGSAEILSFIVSGMGVQAMQSIPIIVGGSVLFGTVLGFVCLHEALSYVGWLGVGLIAIGIGLVGTDPGGSG